MASSACPFGFSSSGSPPPQVHPSEFRELLAEKRSASLENDGVRGIPSVKSFSHDAYALHNHDYVRELHEKYGDIIQVPLHGQDTVFVRNPVTVKRVLTSEDEFTKTFADADEKSSDYIQYFKNLVQPLLKSAEIFGSGDNSSRRQGLKSVFLASNKLLPGFERVMDRLLASWPEGRVDTIELLHPLVFELVMVIMAGEDGVGTQDLLKAAQSCLAHFQDRYTKPLFDEKVTAEDEANMRKVESAAMKMTEAFLEKAKAGTLGPLAKHSMLNVVLGFGLTPTEMNATMVNALFAACEAPIHLLGSALVELSKKPKLQQEILAEVRSVGHQKSPTLNKVMMEALRLHSPVTLIQRRTTQDVVAEGFLIPKDTNVLVCISAVHQNEKYFPRPMEFNPDRPNLGIVMLNPKNGFMPFSSGPRGCPGRYLAVTLMKTAVAFILQKFHLAESENVKTLKIHKFVEFPTDGAFVNLALHPRAKL